MTITAPAPVSNAATSRGRYEFLDALRGVAAMMVVIQHSLELVWPAWERFSLTYFRPGEFGVVLFFLCSGFIIPASLERHGSQSRFWVGRFFRLYPLYWTVLAMVLVLHFGFGRYPLDPQYVHHPLRATAGNATMVQDFLGVPLALGQSWSLAYELAFYGIVSALFVAGLHRRSAPIALGGFAVAMVIGTQRVPTHALAHLGVHRSAVLIVGTALVGAVIWRAARGTGGRRVMAVLIAVAVVPLIVNRPEGFNTACFFFGTLFFGTALYRWSVGQLTNRLMAVLGVAALSTVLIMNMTSKIYWLDPVAGDHLKQAAVATYLGAYAVFVLALTFRDSHFPKALTYLGTISYSLYLNHSLAIYGIGAVGGNRVLTVAVWITVSIVASALTYRWIERPSIDIGHRLGARVSRPVSPSHS
jgi:peptidoglycan/LPS O-acetylase OafA/YrhL